MSNQELFSQCGANLQIEDKEIICIQNTAERYNVECGPNGKGFREDGLSFTIDTQALPHSVCIPDTAQTISFGFPDDYTFVPHNGKPASDSARYKALGNSMAVPVMRWIGERIQMMEEIDRGERCRED